MIEVLIVIGHDDDFAVAAGDEEAFPLPYYPIPEMGQKGEDEVMGFLDAVIGE